MKKIFLILITICFMGNAYAKKVQFSVDMRYQVVDSFGVHVSGNFLMALGYSANWLSDSVQLMQVGSSTIYSTVVDLPAFNMYEYYYLNGKETYQVEFIPTESQVLYNFIANRWFYTDSISTDTLKLPALVFSTNAPVGKQLIRHRVNMQDQSPINNSGVHIALDANSFDYTLHRMYSFDNTIYEYLTYVDSSSASAQKFIFANGNSSSDAEAVPNSCAINNKRNVIINKDTILPTVCFSMCTNCFPLSTPSIMLASNIQLKSNVVSNFLEIENNTGETVTFRVLNMFGQEMKYIQNNLHLQQIDISNLAASLYILDIKTSNNTQTIRWIKK
jgi:hypothetical protein